MLNSQREPKYCLGDLILGRIATVILAIQDLSFTLGFKIHSQWKVAVLLVVLGVPELRVPRAAFQVQKGQSSTLKLRSIRKDGPMVEDSCCELSIQRVGEGRWKIGSSMGLVALAK